MRDDFGEQRSREFAWTDQHVYLNAASYGPLPERSRRATEQFHRRRWNAELFDADLVAPLAGARQAAARLVGAHPDEIALIPNTNTGLNIAASATLARKSGRRTILIHDREFPANVYAWLALERHGFHVELVPADANGLPREEALLARIETGDVATVSVSFVQFASGYRADLETIGAACRRHEVLFAVDAIQGIGAVPLDVAACPVDVLACGGQKWLCSPWGSGFAYVRRELIERLEPLLPGWLAFEASQDFTQLLRYRYQLLDDARRFETGTIAFQDSLGLQYGIELLLELDVARVCQHIWRLHQPLIDWAQHAGVAIASNLEKSRRSGILCLRPANADVVHAALERAGVRCALRERVLRFSPHWYNTAPEIERVVSVLDEHALS